MKIPTIILILFLLTQTIAHSQIDQKDDNVLVEVGNIAITESEFKNRLEFSPKEGIHDKTNEEGIKNELLYTMIAEKLWALEAIELGFENHISVTTAKNMIEKMFVRDALYHKEIKENINLSNEEITLGLERYSKELQVTIFYSEIENKITGIHKQLSTGISIDNVVKNLDSSKTLQKTLLITFGDFDDVNAEDLVDKL